MNVLRVVLICLVVASVVATEIDADKPKAKKEAAVKKAVTVLSPKHFMPKHRVIIVPKGDPRARAPVVGAIPAFTSPAAVVPTPFGGAASSTVLRASATSAACAAKKGTCKASNTCTGTIVTGLCNGGASITCCTPKAANTPTTPNRPSNPTTPSAPSSSCPLYANAQTSRIAGNGNVMYDVVRILAQHFSGSLDNTMTKPTACAFAKMAEAAAKFGANMKIASGFRTYARQKYFYDCYLSKKCNGGNLAARPGNSNHGRGVALDINTDCGKQAKGASRAPAACRNSKVYMFLLQHGRTYGFVRAVQTEPWHWEYKPGQANPSWANL